MRILLISYIIAMWGCNAPPTKTISHDSTRTPETLGEKKMVDTPKLVAKTKTDSLSIEYPPYRELKRFRGDTLNYLQRNFVARKGYYQNKPLYVLFRDLEIPILEFVPIPPSSPIPQEPYGVYLNLENGQNLLHKRKLEKIPNKLVIYTQDTIHNEKLRQLIIKSKLRWNKETEVFFGDKIVKDINTMRVSKAKKQ